MVERLNSGPLAVDESIVMWHVIGQVLPDKTIGEVAITNNPIVLADLYIANIVYYKSRSVDCAKQVARFVRRHFGLNTMTPVRKRVRALEARVGSICTGGYQYPPEEKMPGYELLAQISSTSIADLLKINPDNVPDATRVRYTVYEITSGKRVLRSVTHKFHAVEERWRLSPPPEFVVHTITVVGQFAEIEEALKRCEGFEQVQKDLWPKHPPIDYLRRILKFDEHGHIVWVADGTSAVRPYRGNPLVCIGPRTLTEAMVRRALETGEWIDGRRK